MSNNIHIREESDTDYQSISNVTKAAFEKVDISKQTEHFIIEALRSSKALTISLVAELNGQIVGHIAFSPVNISDGTKGWHGLGPLSVHPNYQNKGIGKALVLEGIEFLKRLNSNGCCLVGHPKYYTKFGFINCSELVHPGIPNEFFFVLPLKSNIPNGFVTFHDAFKANS